MTSKNEEVISLRQSEEGILEKSSQELLDNLEIIKLQDLKHITVLPDLSMHMNLQKIFLINTGINLKSLPDGIKEKVFNWDDR